MRNYTLKKFFTDLLILGLTSIIVSTGIYFAIVLVLLNAITVT